MTEFTRNLGAICRSVSYVGNIALIGYGGYAVSYGVEQRSLPFALAGVALDVAAGFAFSETVKAGQRNK